MKELSFALEVEDGWPPVATEHLWCEDVEGGFVLRSVPFFVHGLAVGDRFAAELDPVNGCIFEFEMVRSSGHSLVRVLEPDGMNLEPYKHELLALGCTCEEFRSFGVNAFDVPAGVEAHAIGEIVDRIDDAGFPIAFPVWRHEPGGA